MNKVLTLIFTIVMLMCNVNGVMASQSTAPVSDEYSGRDDLKTLALGRSAFTDDGRGGVGVNVYKKTDGQYVVLIIHDGKPKRRGRSKSTPKEYVKAYVNGNHQVYFTWQGRKYTTPSDPYNFK